MSKKKVIIGLIGIGILGLVGNEIYTFHKEGDSKSSSIVSNDKYIDKNNEYIINPNIEMLKEFEWATWRDSAGGRLSRDSTWFIEPSDKYKSQEISFNWSLVKNKTALEKRNAYFNHLCNTEASSYTTKNYPKDLNENIWDYSSSMLIIRINEHPIKNMVKFINTYQYSNSENIKEQKNKLVNKILTSAQQNPYINPNFGYFFFKEGELLKFDLRSFTLKDKKEYLDNLNYGPKRDTFREFMDQEGNLYKLSYNYNTKQYQPIEKITKSEAQYYTLYREIERDEMKKLGIFGKENIVVDKKNHQLVQYYKTFNMPTYLDSIKESNFNIPINWNWINNCNKNDINSFRVITELDSL